jgi:LysR family transcriptional regulator, glycine cleavage system transcriptional activator
MRRRLPPLNAVRAFEAAARHLSFQRAGEELSVTPGAIAQQVKALEAWLGKPMFRRLPSKGVVLSEPGQLYAPVVRDLLDGLADATARLMRQAGPGVLMVSTIPSFAARWLIPRLGAFRMAHPDLEVRVLAHAGLTDFAREQVDVAIRLGQGVYPGLRSDLLMSETLFPVCSPTLLTDEAKPLREPADLRHHTLLHEDS